MSKTAEQLRDELEKDVALAIIGSITIDGDSEIYLPMAGVGLGINKVLDAVQETIKKQPHYMCDTYYNSATPSEDEYGNCLNGDKTIEAINKLRPSGRGK